EGKSWEDAQLRRIRQRRPIAGESLGGLTGGGSSPGGNWAPPNLGSGPTATWRSRPPPDSQSKEGACSELERNPYGYRRSSGAEQLGVVCVDEETCRGCRCGNYPFPTTDARDPQGTVVRSFKDGLGLCGANAEGYSVRGLRLGSGRVRWGPHERRILS